MSVLFVCLGNICRSPIAEAIARHYDKEGQYDSAGISSYHQGEKPCKGMADVAHKHKVSLEGICARPISYPQDEGFDWIVCMDEQNYQDLLELGFSVEKVRKLGEFGFGGADVPDPYYYHNHEGFEKVYSMIKQCTVNLLETLKEQE